MVTLKVENTFIHTTPDHPFYIKNKWVKAEDIHTGDSVTFFNGRKGVIMLKTAKDTVYTVYNFAVENFHTYFVSNLQVLVHNNDGCYVIIKDKVLKKQGIDAHVLKQTHLGDKAPIARFDLYKNKNTNEIFIFQKGGMRCVHLAARLREIERYKFFQKTRQTGFRPAS